MRSTEEIIALAQGVEPVVPIEHTKFTSPRWPTPFFEPYQSMRDQIEANIRLFKRANRVRQNALHPIYLQAGKSEMPGGEFGRPAAPNPILLPEQAGGRLLYTNV